MDIFGGRRSHSSECIGAVEQKSAYELFNAVDKLAHKDEKDEKNDAIYGRVRDPFPCTPNKFKTAHYHSHYRQASIQPKSVENRAAIFK